MLQYMCLRIVRFFSFIRSIFRMKEASPMDRSMPYLLIAFIGMIVVVYLMFADRRRARMQRLKVKKLYASPLFEAMRPMLRQAQKYSIESLTIDKTGFTIRFLFPFGHETKFCVTDHGYPNLTIDRQETLLMLMEEVVPKLTASLNTFTNCTSAPKVPNSCANMSGATFWSFFACFWCCSC